MPPVRVFLAVLEVVVPGLAVAAVGWMLTTVQPPRTGDRVVAACTALGEQVRVVLLAVRLPVRALMHRRQ